MECLYHISQSSESIYLSNIRTLVGLLPFHKLTPRYIPWGGAAGQNIEHPHTLFFLARCNSGELCCPVNSYVLLMVRKFSQWYFIIFMTSSQDQQLWSLFKKMLCACTNHDHMNHVMRKPVLCHMRTARCRSASTFTQSDQCLCCSLPRKYNPYSCYTENFKTLSSFHSWADWFESFLVPYCRRQVFSWLGPYIT